MSTWYVRDTGVGAVARTRSGVNANSVPPPRRSSHRERLRADLKMQLLDLLASTSASPTHLDFNSTVVAAASSVATGEHAREKFALDAAIENYLAVTPHERKFQFATCVEIFQKGLFVVPFSPEACQVAWENLSQYAANLLVRPWRPEYKTMKLYGGFFRHYVEAALPDSYRVFALMGYSMVLGENNSVLRISGPLDFDMILGVYLDCLIASAECRVMMHVLEKLQDLPISWYQVVAVREKYICSADQAADLLRQEFVENELAAALNNRCDDCYRPVPPQRRHRSKAVPQPQSHHHHHQHMYQQDENDYALRPATFDDHSEASWNLVKDAGLEKTRTRQPAQSPVSREGSPSAESWSYVYDALNNGAISPKPEKVPPPVPAKPSKSKLLSSLKKTKEPAKHQEERRQKRQESTPAQWSCKACTFLNPNDAKVCAMCAKSRDQGPVLAADEREDSGGLECPKCTYINSEDAKECAMCRESFI